MRQSTQWLSCSLGGAGEWPGWGGRGGCRVLPVTPAACTGGFQQHGLDLGLGFLPGQLACQWVLSACLSVVTVLATAVGSSSVSGD